jgi:hypothetical protein
MTYQALKAADLIVFCLTHMLFDNVTAGNFRKLAFEQGYAPKMLLVVNKMSDEAGAREVLIENYSASLNQALAPHLLSAFPHVFVDARDYIRGVDDSDAALVEESHFLDLVAALNQLVTTKGTLARMDTPIRVALGSVEESQVVAKRSDDEDSTYLLILTKLARVIRNERDRLRSSVRVAVLDLCGKIAGAGSTLASQLGQCKDFDSECKKAEGRVEDLIRECLQQRVVPLIEEAATRVQEAIKGVLDSELATEFYKDIHGSGHVKFGNVVELEELHRRREQWQRLENVGKTLAETLSRVAVGPSALGAQGFLRAGQVAGSHLHHVVYGVGKFFGHAFQPWQAVNIAKTIGNVAKVAGPILAVVGMALDGYTEYKESERAEQLSVGRREISGHFSALAGDVERSFVAFLGNEVEPQVFGFAEERIVELRRSEEEGISAANEMQQGLKAIRVELEDLVRVVSAKFSERSQAA